MHVPTPLLALLFTLLVSTLSHAGTATLFWNPPTTNADGTPLGDLAGYKVFIGTSPGQYDRAIDVGLTPTPETPTYTVNNLIEGNTYYFVATAYDSSQNESVPSNQGTKTVPIPDTKPPTLSGIATGNFTDSSVTVSWRTDEPATSQVEYGTTTAYGNRTSPVSTLETDHRHTLTGLIPDTVYHYKIRSTDAAGNPGLSADRTVMLLSSSSGNPQTLRPVQDTFINLNTEVNIDALTLNTYTWPKDSLANAILMKFDLSALPAGATIQNATLHLYLIKSDSTAEPAYAIGLHKMVQVNPDLTKATGYTYNGSKSWTPNSCCHNNIPLGQMDISPAYDVQEVDKAAGYKTWDMTAMAQEWINQPATNFGLMLNSDPTHPKDGFRYFASMEDPDTRIQPYLSVTYTSRILSPAQDTFLNVNSDVNVAAHTLNTYTWPDFTLANAILMKFDLSGIPTGMKIQNATLNLYLVSSDAQSDPLYTVSAHKMINRNPDLDKATGYTYDGSNSWTANACCYNNIPLAQGDISPPYDSRAVDKTPGFKTWDLTDMVQEWVNMPGTNFGLLLNSDFLRNKDRYRTFASKENEDSNLRPYLIITYGP